MADLGVLDYVLLVSMMIVAVLIIVINSIEIYILSTVKNLKTKANLIISSLAVADLLVGFLLPIGASFGFKLWENDEVCTTAYFGTTFLTTVSMHHLFFVSLDRFILITYPLRYPMIMTTKKCNAFIVVSWISSFGFAILPVFGVGRQENYICDAENYYGLWYIIMLFVVNFQTPLIFMTYMYYKIYAIAKKHRQQIKAEMTYFNTQTQSNIKSAKILFVMCVYFLFSWMPYFVMVSIPLITSRQVIVPPKLVQLSVGLAFANSLGNPLLYGYFNRDVRSSVRKMFRRRGGGVNEDSQNHTASTIVDTGSRNVDTGSRTVDTGSRTVDTVSRNVDTGSRSVDTASRNVDTVSRNVDSTSRNLDTGYTNVETGSRNVDTARTNVDTVNRNVETVNRNVETVKRNIDTASRNIDTVNINVDTGSRNIDTANTNVDTVNINVDTVNINVDTGSRNVDTGSRNVDTANRNVDTTNRNVDTANTNVDSRF